MKNVTVKDIRRNRETNVKPNGRNTNVFKKIHRPILYVDGQRIFCFTSEKPLRIKSF